MTDLTLFSQNVVFPVDRFDPFSPTAEKVCFTLVGNLDQLWPNGENPKLESIRSGLHMTQNGVEYGEYR